MANINLSAAVRSNLTSLQDTASLMSKTSDRLSSGNKVNSALDNPTNFFTASSLNSRAGDLNNLMDSMANGIKTIEAANNGLTSITKNLESMQSTLRQARQDKSFQTESFSMETKSTVTLNGGQLGTDDVTIGAAAGAEGTAVVPGDVISGKFSISVGNTKVELSTKAAVAEDLAAVPPVAASPASTAADVAKSINDNATLKKAGITASVDADKLTLTNASGKEVDVADVDAGTLAGIGLAAETIDATGAIEVGADDAVRILNNFADTAGKVRASNDKGSLRIENLSTSALNVTAGTTSAEIGGNTVRADLATQFNELRDQLDKLSDDASFNGINLLRGDNLKITFNETGTSSIDIQTKGGTSVNSANLDLETTLSAADLDSDAGIDAFLDQVKGALNNVRSQSSAFGSNLSIVQNRQDFTKSMINTLETGAGNLTLADMNQEAANMMALQTRQSLASSTLSMANQADQGVLQLLR